MPREELLAQVHGKHALFCLLTDTIDAEVLEAAGELAACDGFNSLAHAMNVLAQG